MWKPKLDESALERLGITVEREAPLAALTTMKVGGPAEYLAAVATEEQLLALVRWSRSVELPYFVLGGGSNILISDAGIRGLVIHNRCRRVRIETGSGKEVDALLSAESGAAMAGVARRSIQEGWAGLEWAVSVPGTVGGAVVGNAGAHGGEVKDNLAYARLLDEQGKISDERVGDLSYAYRDSRLKRRLPLRAAFNPVVLSAAFRLTPGDRAVLRARAEQFLAHRRRTQPVAPSLGSTFVNPPDDFAGRLIEEAGLKGMRVGGVEVSTLHANFIINRGGVGHATAADVMRLIELIRARVLQQFGVQLEPEVQLAGEWGSSA
jgi:UDP-N-acetylmuramate dehydrogenase